MSSAKLSNLLRQCLALSLQLECKPIEVLNAVHHLIRDRELAEQAEEQLPTDGSNQEPRHGR